MSHGVKAGLENFKSTFVLVQNKNNVILLTQKALTRRVDGSVGKVSVTQVWT